LLAAEIIHACTHEGAWEVFYCVSGEGILDDGTNEYPLKAGDALVGRRTPTY